MTPTLILCFLIGQIVFAVVGLAVWRRLGRKHDAAISSNLTEEVRTDADRCQVLLGNIGQLLNTHSQLLCFLSRPDQDKLRPKRTDPIANACSNKKIQFGRLLDHRVDELSGVLERYNDLYLHERLQLKDYAGRADELESLLGDLESKMDEKGAILLHLVRDMLSENQKLRQTVEGCRSRISELIVVAIKSGRDARLDALTQLPNRRAWIERISQPQGTVKQAIGILDIDNFKSLNDGHGHPAGDAVLTMVARLMRDDSRLSPFRTGGDEFFLLVDAGSSEDGRRVLDSLRTRIERASVLVEGQRLMVTVTMGVAYPLENESLDDTIQRADKALYDAKERGKNCVIASNDNAFVAAAGTA